MVRRTIPLFALALVWLLSAHAGAIEILVDYTYDTENFFNTQAKRDSIEAAAGRWAAIIDSPLLEIDAGYDGGNSDWRVGFTHPGTGNGFQISTAPSSSPTDDIIVQLGGASAAANVYDPSFVLPQDTWILFAGGRDLSSAAVGGTGTGLNLTSTFNDPLGPLRRGLGTNLGASGLPAWGGSIAFDNNGVNWNYDTSIAAPSGTTDLYSIALHEIGHALGLNTTWTDFTDLISGNAYQGANAVAAYNADNGASLSTLSLAGGGNPHWANNTYDSFIFEPGNPNYVGTVGTGVLQDLEMEPVADFTGTIRRLELTNVDVGEAQDIGWSVVPEPTACALGLIGFAAFGLMLWRRRRNRSRN